MTRYATVQGVGRDVKSATKDLYEEMKQIAGENEWPVPESVEDAGKYYKIKYIVGVRKPGKNYTEGERNTDLNLAYDSALKFAKIEDRAKIYSTRVSARLDLRKDAPTKLASTARGKPSGASSSVSGGLDITDLF